MKQRAHTNHHPEYYSREFGKKGRPQMLMGVGHYSRNWSALNFMHYIWDLSRKLGLQCCVSCWAIHEHKPAPTSGIFETRYIAWEKGKNSKTYFFFFEGLIFFPHFHPTPIWKLFSAKSVLPWNQILGILASSFEFVVMWHRKILYLREVDTCQSASERGTEHTQWF